jgi:hypothetical protein
MPHLKQCIRRAVAGKVGFLNWLLCGSQPGHCVGTCPGTEAGDYRLPLPFVAQWTGRLRVPQLPFGFELMLLVTVRFHI